MNSKNTGLRPKKWIKGENFSFCSLFFPFQPTHCSLPFFHQFFKSSPILAESKPFEFENLKSKWIQTCFHEMMCVLLEFVLKFSVVLVYGFGGGKPRKPTVEPQNHPGSERGGSRTSCELLPDAIQADSGEVSSISASISIFCFALCCDD